MPLKRRRSEYRLSIILSPLLIYGVRNTSLKLQTRGDVEAGCQEGDNSAPDQVKRCQEGDNLTLDLETAWGSHSGTLITRPHTPPGGERPN